MILDEVQNVPSLLSYIQGLVDEDPRPGRFVLTGSQNFALSDAVVKRLVYGGDAAQQRSAGEVIPRHEVAGCGWAPELG